MVYYGVCRCGLASRVFVPVTNSSSDVYQHFHNEKPLQKMLHFKRSTEEKVASTLRIFHLFIYLFVYLFYFILFFFLALSLNNIFSQ